MLIDLKQRGLALAPKLAAGDGALGFWAALRKVFPETREQRCWVHKTANVLNKMPKSMQLRAKADLHEIWMAETREQAGKAFDAFPEKYQAKYEAACNCLAKDRDVLRLPSRTLEALAHDQPDRVNLRDDSPATSQDETADARVVSLSN